MNDISSRDEALKSTSVEILDVLGCIADAAARHMRESGHDPSVMASVNTFTSTHAIVNLSEISDAVRAADAWLLQEPAIARVVVIGPEGRQDTLYVCRASPPSGLKIDGKVASYRSPMGRLASLKPGDILEIAGDELELLKRSHIHPLNDGTWDSRHTTFESVHQGPVTIVSLRDFVRSQLPSIDETLLDRILAEETAEAQILEGMRRKVLKKMGLRDQPILDKYQDDIFRSPLKRRLLLLGPPGTGKTTTLIRRLGQKLDRQFLDDGERALVDQVAIETRMSFDRSWVMFTPTELLKQYVREAFAREGIAAPDDRIRTWEDYRQYLARSVFGVLRTATGGTFVLREGAAAPKARTSVDISAWANDFLEWQVAEYRRSLSVAAERLATATLSNAAELGVQAAESLKAAEDRPIEETVIALAKLAPKLQAALAASKESTDAVLRGSLNLQLNRNRQFIDELVKFLGSLQDVETSQFDEDDEAENEEEEVAEAPMPRLKARQAYERAVRAAARAWATGRKLPVLGRNARIIDWLEGRLPAEDELDRLGVRLVTQSDLRKLVNPSKSYLDGTPARYRAFRRARQKEGKWYDAQGPAAGDIHALELDLLLLAMLRSAWRLASQPEVRARVGESPWSALQPFLTEMRTQILVDEATDFSPVQLACMHALAHPDTQSFFACGDFNQRLTSWGSRSDADVFWAVQGIETQRVEVAYRQSSQLHQLSNELIRVGGGQVPDVRLPDNVDNQGVPPLLVEGVGSVEVCASWLAARIQEVERMVGTVPSIAVLVAVESSVQPMTDALNAALEENSIRAVACHDGQALGQEQDVRIFDIQHVKGLEFEAVFFVHVDRLAASQPELFDKYLYVGTSRAAVYLGMVCENQLPEALEPLRSTFAQRWDASMLEH
jgi:hypothetical protein